MPISTEQAMSAYGFVWQLANSIPELKGILDQATREAWTPDKLTATVESSGWWRSNSDTVRNLATMQATDPATYSQNLANAKNLVALKARQMGRNLSDDAVNRVAWQTLVSNASWDDQVLSSTVASAGGLERRTEGGQEVGQAADMENHLLQVARSYGVPLTQGYLDGWIDRVQTGYDTVDGFETLMRVRAKQMFPQLAGQIDAGMTVRDIADPYISQMAQTLEIPETAINLDDGYVRRALSTGDSGDEMGLQPMWKFEQTLKRDPRYDNTKQAKSDAMSTLRQIGKDWGFSG